MEGSINTRVVALADEEESGWTAYFQDFSDHHHSLSSSFCTSSSMVSDAASFPAWKSFNNNKHDSVASSCIGASPNNIPSKLTFEKTRAKEISHDYSLEDTASSPVSSPKVSDDIDINSRKKNDHFNSSLGKGSSLEDYEGVVVETEERFEKSCSGNNDCTDLKKKGLCLVPLTMLVNYLG